MTDNVKFAILPAQSRIWAVAAVHGELSKLQKIHVQLADNFTPGDKLIYMGNLLGHGPDVEGVLNEVLCFRRLVILQEGADVDDVIFLRGCQEEMLYKLRQIPFAQEPEDVLIWMRDQGVDATLRVYGTSCEDGIRAAREGMRGLNRWMNNLKFEMQKKDGHNKYMDALKRAAFSENKTLLFVNANVAAEKPLDAQTDDFWWGVQDFRELDHPYGNFARVVRGYDHRHEGVHMADHHICLDAGCGMGGKLIAACFDPSGSLIERLEA